MKKLLIVLISLFCVISINAESLCPVGDTSENKELTVEQMIVLVRKASSMELREKILISLENKANSGDPLAMNAMGVLYLQGAVINKDAQKSLFWFEKAHNLGLKKASYNLAMMHRRGIGVPQDFFKSFEFIKSSYDVSQPQTIYAQGYFWYKGLGCEQNYAKAITLFKTAAKEGHGYAMYMLGLCYRNGYGVDRNSVEANFWLTKASQKKVLLSNDELQNDLPENPIQSVLLKPLTKSVSKDTPQRFKRVMHELKPMNLEEGEYVGTLVTYDWSGKYPIEEKNLSVEVKRSGESVLLNWKEGDNKIVDIEGVLTDTALVFKKACYSKKDHYHMKDPVTWNFVRADLRATTYQGITNLAGNLQLYSPETKEPQKPMYLTLNKNIQESSIEEEKKYNVSLYPNPFIDNVNLSFTLSSECKCSIQVVDMKGTVIFQRDLGILSMGEQHFQFYLDAGAGNYVVKLIYGDLVYNGILMKEK